MQVEKIFVGKQFKEAEFFYSKVDITWNLPRPEGDFSIIRFIFASCDM